MISHKGTVTLETERLILRRFELSDNEDMFYNWAGDSAVARFVPWEPYKTLESVKECIDANIKDYERNDTYKWVIVLKDINMAIGTIAVVEISEKSEWVEIGYNIGKAWWNQGITTEALISVLEYLFEYVKVHRIQAIFNGLNPASGRVMQKAGMTLEGVLRQHSKQPDGSFDDVLIYSILRNEWSKLTMNTEKKESNS